MNRVLYTCRNGLGDKLLDVIGACTVCNYLNYSPAIFFNIDAYKWDWGISVYDERLFNFSGFELVHQNNMHEYTGGKVKYYIEQHGFSSVGLSPYKAFHFLKGILPDIIFEEVSKQYCENATRIIQPSAFIESKIPGGLENAYGIHLRKSDKILDKVEDANCGWLMDKGEFQTIIKKIIETVAKVIQEEEFPSFLIVSEDAAWKKEITAIVLKLGGKYRKQIKIIDIEYGEHPEYFNFESVVDMFSLSRCKQIIQGVKYSSFSILAALLGNRKLINFSEYTNNIDRCYIHCWNSVLNINDRALDFNVDHYQLMNSIVKTPETNINSAFETI